MAIQPTLQNAEYNKQGTKVMGNSLTRIYKDEIVVTGSYPGSRIDIDNLRPGDVCFYCDTDKNRSKKKFYVIKGYITKWDPKARMYEAEFEYRFKYQRRNTQWICTKQLFSNEIGDTPERAVNNMLRFPWEGY